MKIKRALLIGINYFGTSSELGGCINDVHNMKKFLIDNFHYSEDNMLILTDDQKDTKYHPTVQNILNGLDWLIKGAKEGDHLFLHYSGHGSWEWDRDGDEADGKDEVICPVDCDTNGMISDDVLRERLAEKVPAGCQCTMIMDCCHSGTNFDLRYNYTQRADGSLTIKKEGQYKRTTGKVVMFSGCMDRQTSADATEQNVETNRYQRQGAMTWSFIKVMTMAKCQLRYKTLIQRIRRLLKKEGYSQIPQMAAGRWLKLRSRINV